MIETVKYFKIQIFYAISQRWVPAQSDKIRVIGAKLNKAPWAPRIVIVGNSVRTTQADINAIPAKTSRRRLSRAWRCAAA